MLSFYRINFNNQKMYLFLVFAKNYIKLKYITINIKL